MVRVSVVAAALAPSLASTIAATAAYTCSSDVNLGATMYAAKKGIALDDSTLHWCAHQVPVQWPNSGGAMSSIRLFKAWDVNWNEGEKDGAWTRLTQYVQSANAKVLVGTQISCNETADNQAWEWTKQLVARLGSAHVMGLAIGNELELLQFKGGGAMIPDACLKDIWDNGYYWRQFQRMVGEFDTAGFAAVPVTAVFTGLGLAGDPFYELPGKARVKSFLKNATQAYPTRFAFTWNFYPYFDPNLRLDAGTSDKCAAALATAGCWGVDCSVPAQTRAARAKMQQLTGSADATLWIGETGWSSPVSTTLTTELKNCPAWSSMDTFQTYYRGFLAWDLNIGGGVKAPEHVFWFTMRDSNNFGEDEHFGLIAQCDQPACKVASQGYEVRHYGSFNGPAKKQCVGPIVYNGWSRGEDHCRNLCTLSEACKFFGTWPHSYADNWWCMLTESCGSFADATLEVTIYEKTAPAQTSSTSSTSSTTGSSTASISTSSSTSSTASSSTSGSSGGIGGSSSMPTSTSQPSLGGGDGNVPPSGKDDSVRSTTTAEVDGPGASQMASLNLAPRRAASAPAAWIAALAAAAGVAARRL